MGSVRATRRRTERCQGPRSAGTGDAGHVRSWSHGRRKGHGRDSSLRVPRQPPNVSPMHVPDIASLRIEYESVGIDPADMGDDPVEEFTAWLTAAVEAGVVELNAFVLAT